MTHPKSDTLDLNLQAAKAGDLLNAFRWTATNEGSRFWCGAWEGEIPQREWQPKLDAIMEGAA